MTKEKESLAPLGDTLPNAKYRLNTAPQDHDPEMIMMKLWEEENVRRYFLNGGRVPLEAILFLPREVETIQSRDRQVVAATLQWLATNCGRSFLHEFQKRVKTSEDVRMSALLAQMEARRSGAS